MVFNATFNNISAISWRSVLLVEETGEPWRQPQICLKLLANFITYYCIEYTSPWTGFELTTLGTDCTGSCKFNYHTITTANAPIYISGVMLASRRLQGFNINTRKYTANNVDTRLRILQETEVSTRNIKQ